MRAFDQLVADIGCFAGTADDDGVARLLEGGVAEILLCCLPVLKIGHKLIAGHQRDMPIGQQ